jgi:alanyl-tRNA synthetase
MNGHQIRQTFLEFFAARGHQRVRSSSLVPLNDPTLLFTNAGMNQFKDVFLGADRREYSRATTSQKCVRAGGKHNDLDNVGYTRRHHTFFEMLGNFSFGDYFKAEAIEFAWELVTTVYGMDKERLYVTVFREDDEAEELWQKVAGVSKSRIFRLDEKDNFWQMGDTGPCGPCSEIHFDLGPDAAEPGREHEAFPLDGGGRFVEIWNLVFMQFDRDASGTLSPLPSPSIDTGMGLERVAAILQGQTSNYDSDLLKPIILRAADLFGVSFGRDPKVDTILRIVADHARAAEFLIYDGVVPSNEGRGYVLRKIMRRAIRNARRAGADKPFYADICAFVAEFMSPAYPELEEAVGSVSRIVSDEEQRYAATYQVAERMFRDEAAKAASGVIPGSAVFRLYDTFGLALDEQEEMARELGLSLDRAAFDQEMDIQRERARASWKAGDKSSVSPVYQELLAAGATVFSGYDALESGISKVTGLLIDGRRVDSVGPGSDCELVLDVTPFYAESGGQVGDQGLITELGTGMLLASVESVYRPVAGLFVHRVRTAGPIHVGDAVRASVFESARRATARNHTATHLLHAALRTVLGPHVKQAGSVVEPSRLRFDFSHYTQVTPAELVEIERLVNDEVFCNEQVTTEVMDIESARSSGAMALFGEKYGDSVRVVTVPGFSRELCGGTHVGRTGDIGLIKIISEAAVSAGVRRIEAVTGDGALRRFQDQSGLLQRLSLTLKTSEAELVEQLDRALGQQRAMEAQLEQLKERVAQAQLGSLASSATVIGGVHVVVSRVEGLDRAQMRTLADALRNKLQPAVVALASPLEEGAALLVAVSKEATAKVAAGKLVGAMAEVMGGKGGGRPDLAEAGGKDLTRLDEALSLARRTIEAALHV